MTDTDPFRYPLDREPDIESMSWDDLRDEYVRLYRIQARAEREGHEALYLRIQRRLDRLVKERAERNLKRMDRDADDGREVPISR